jgi:hypothetical protein
VAAVVADGAAVDGVGLEADLDELPQADTTNAAATAAPNHTRGRPGIRHVSILLAPQHSPPSFKRR